MRLNFPLFLQHDAMDCGPSCLRSILTYYDKIINPSRLRDLCSIDRHGVSLKGIAAAAERFGFNHMAIKIEYGDRTEQPCLLSAPLPLIAHWNQNHFIVVYKVSKNKVHIADPAAGKFVISREEFEMGWVSDNGQGIALLLEPGKDFYKKDEGDESKYSFINLLDYLSPYKKLITQLVLGLIIGSVLQLFLPLLTQSIVDIGIQTSDIQFIYLVLIGQLALFAGQTIIRLIQSRILLHIGTRVNVQLISDFLIKLMKLPLSYFDSKHTGDLMQRIGDHSRIESFLTQSLLNAIFSIFTIILFGIVLVFYHVPIFLVFIISTVLYLGWVFFFLRRRKEIDYRLFAKHAANQDNVIEIINGMAEIKLQGSQSKRRQQWMHTQADLFNANMCSLQLSQYQDAGGMAINQLKDILITIIAATAVIKGVITLGVMIAIQFIIGQLNLPIQSLIQFIRSWQDAKLSFERLGEIHGMKNEHDEKMQYVHDIPDDHIIIDNLSFRYTPILDDVLHDINCTIEKGKVTAIVGSSGSGKTTLIKILLGFYENYVGKISIGYNNFSSLEKQGWRSHCGAVMQDGYIFSDTIANNIAESDDHVDKQKLADAVNIANIKDFIDELPLKYNTMIGAKGNGISQGQRQRMLIARAVYKNPKYMFFDEATNALDAVNERTIMNNLNQFYKGRTVVVVAHRLSTVKNADKIIVLEKGRIVETGTHKELVALQGKYFELVSNQLELGN